MSEFKFVPGEYKTRDGRRAIVRFCVQEPYNTLYPLVGEMLLRDCKTWDRACWTAEGQFDCGAECPSDLVAPVRYCYINVYARNAGGAYSSLEEADEHTANDREGVLVAEIDLVGNIKWGTIGFMTRKGCVHA